MAHSYASETPSSIPLPEGVKTYFEEFYRISDTPDAHERYVSSFTPDAGFIMASKRGKGSDEIMEIRKGMWKVVKSRQHTANKIFPFGGVTREGAQEVMLYGTVKYELLDGKRAEVEWAARAELVKGESEAGWKMRFYQVYLDTAAMANAK